MKTAGTTSSGKAYRERLYLPRWSMSTQKSTQERQLWGFMDFPDTSDSSRFSGGGAPPAARESTVREAEYATSSEDTSGVGCAPPWYSVKVLSTLTSSAIPVLQPLLPKSEMSLHIALCDPSYTLPQTQNKYRGTDSHCLDCRYDCKSDTLI